jgi:SPP1 family predicted phage head-tail adaptor
MNDRKQAEKSLATRARHYLTLQRKTETSDGEGGFTESWADQLYFFGSLDPLKAWQQYNNASVGVDTTHIVATRGLIDVKEHDRVKLGSRIFEVQTVENIEERGFVQVITCKERR